jgi:exosortase family protein XrtF
MSAFSIREFRPTIIFLIKFLILYLIGNLVYGWYVKYYHPAPDPVTHEVTRQTGMLLQWIGWPVIIQDHQATTVIICEGKSILSVYEGCNGLNTTIIFAAFIIAFGPISRSILWFIPFGALLIHLSNLTRISLLFYVWQVSPEYMYFAHKYLFTAALYLVVFVLWVWWVRNFSDTKSSEKS